jgi:hypothetical protein
MDSPQEVYYERESILSLGLGIHVLDMPFDRRDLYVEFAGDLPVCAALR